MTASPAELAIASGKTALICGITGQDGSYLARHLLQLGYRVVGTSRDAQAARCDGLVKLGIREHVQVESMSLIDFRSTFQVISTVMPDEIYNLAGHTSVSLSFQLPVETLESIVIGTVNLLEAIRMLRRPIRFFNAGSSEMYGNAGDEPCSEETRLRPCSPYGIAKATSFWQVAQYRDAYGLMASTGILFNHESPLRPARFVTKKIVDAAARIARGEQQVLTMGDLSVRRDWGWAPEYVGAVHRIATHPTAEDFVIATGLTVSLEDFVQEVFAGYGLDWKQYVQFDKSLERPAEIAAGRATPAKAAEILGWEARQRMPEIARLLVDVHEGRRDLVGEAIAS